MNRSPCGIALLGNPGTGKSTILNGLVGQTKFGAGISIASGLTTKLQSFKHNGRIYYDTPGLDCVKKRKEVGAEIDKLLSKNESIKIAFVVTLMQGRARAEDATTVKLVLDAIKSVSTKDKFGVIVNQISPEVLKLIKQNETKEHDMQIRITGERRTSHWCYVLNNPDLRSKRNGMLMTSELNKFFHNLPETRPVGASVAKVDLQLYHKMLLNQYALNDAQKKIDGRERQDLEDQLKSLHELNEKLRAALKKERSDCKAMQAEKAWMDLLKKCKDMHKYDVKYLNNESKNLRESLQKCKEEIGKFETKALKDRKNEMYIKEQIKLINEELKKQDGRCRICTIM